MLTGTMFRLSLRRLSGQFQRQCRDFHVCCPTPATSGRRLLLVPSAVPPVNPNRTMAKGRDRKKEHRSADRPRVTLDDEEMERVIRFDEFQSQVDAMIDEFKNDLKLNYNVKINPRIIETLQISYEGITVSLGEICQIVRKQQDLVINLSATPGAVKPILNALNESGLNLNPQPDGQVIYVRMPRVTTEHRQTLAKSVRAAGQRLKDEVKNRNFQKKFHVKMDGNRRLSQDLINDVQDNLNHYVRQRCLEIDNIVKQKEDSLLNS